ncbi:MAG: DUF4127 family protein [Anaerolineae bacterium]|nr:DUF4127 family protein [Anaerolineae bacterium]
MNIALLPLDERPVNIRYPQQIAEIAAVQLHVPPAQLLPKQRHSADIDGLSAWLRQIAPMCDGSVASVELLGYGGLISSRITHDSVGQILARLAPLHHLRQPSHTSFVFNVIQRTSNADDAIEEPLYWANDGRRLYDYSRVLDLALQGNAVAMAQRAVAEQAIPPDIRHDWLTRRARNHAVNLAMLHAAAMGAFDLLVISSDDTSPVGVAARERKHLEAIKAMTMPDASAAAQARVLMYPGADDVGTALVARLINQHYRHQPRVFVHYFADEMRQNVAPYEDQPIAVSVQNQIRAVGAIATSDLAAADVILCVSPPFERLNGQDPHWRDHDTPQRRQFLSAAVMQLEQLLGQGRTVALADVAFPNGAEPLLVDLLLAHASVAQLASFGAWNTASNTLGSTLAAACVPCRNLAARQRTLAHHLLEGWGYQSLVRPQLWAEGYASQPVPAVMARAEALLRPILAQLAPHGLAFALHNVTLPWQRLFEVDFCLI